MGYQLSNNKDFLKKNTKHTHTHIYYTQSCREPSRNVLAIKEYSTNIVIYAVHYFFTREINGDDAIKYGDGSYHMLLLPLPYLPRCPLLLFLLVKRRVEQFVYSERPTGPTLTRKQCVLEWVPGTDDATGAAVEYLNNFV